MTDAHLPNWLSLGLVYLAAAVVIIPIRAEQRTAQARAEEWALMQARTAASEREG